MTAITVTETMLVDALPLAEELELLLRDYMPETARGFYLPGKNEPVMLEGKYYYKRVLTANGLQDVPIQKLEDIDSDVFNDQHELVLPVKRAGQVTFGPRLPVRGLRLVHDLIDMTLSNCSAWKKHKISLKDVLEHHLDEIKYTNDLMLDLIDSVGELTLELRSFLVEFIGTNKWIMHFQKPWGLTNIIIEKTGDYRIYDWERRMKSGEWKLE